MRKALAFLLLALALTGITPAFASDCYRNSSATQADCGVVNMYLNGSSQAVAVTPTAPLPVTAPNAQYPVGATPITASATGTTAATTATLAAVSGKTTWLCGLSIRANATAAATGNATVTGTITGTLNFTQWTAPLASGIGIAEPPIGPLCIPASGTNQVIAVVSAALGSGGTVSVTAWGYQLRRKSSRRSPTASLASGSRRSLSVLPQLVPPKPQIKPAAVACRSEDEPARPFAEIVVDYETLIAACRARCDFLHLSRESVDAIAGWAPGLASKILSTTPIKYRGPDGKRKAARRLGMQSLGQMLAALGLRLVAVEDPETLERYRNQRTHRDESRVRKAHPHERAVAKLSRWCAARGLTVVIDDDTK